MTDGFIDNNNFKDFSEFLIFLYGNDEDGINSFPLSYSLPDTKWDMVEITYKDNKVIKIKHYNDFGIPQEFKSYDEMMNYINENFEGDMQELEDNMPRIKALDYSKVFKE